MKFGRILFNVLTYILKLKRLHVYPRVCISESFYKTVLATISELWTIATRTCENFATFERNLRPDQGQLVDAIRSKKKRTMIMRKARLIIMMSLKRIIIPHDCNPSVSMALNVRFTTNGMYAKSDTHIYEAVTSNNRASCELYYCFLPQCEALRTFRSGFPIATARNHRSCRTRKRVFPLAKYLPPPAASSSVRAASSRWPSPAPASGRQGDGTSRPIGALQTGHLTRRRWSLSWGSAAGLASRSCPR